MPSPEQAERALGEHRLFLVDASALLYRAHFAFLRRPLTTSSGQHVGALFGFASTLLALLRDERARYVGMVFDPPGPTFRHELFPAYKANRPEMPPELSEQFPLAHRLIRALAWEPIVREGYEADDVIGSMAARATAGGWRTVIVSGDKDFGQLIDDRIVQYVPSRSREPAQWVGPEQVQEKWGVAPAQFTDFLALTGDSSDNVPGVRGIGPKTAAKLLGDYGSLEGIYEQLKEVTPAGVRKKLEAGHEDALLSRRLVRIRTDLEVTPPEALEVPDPAEQTALRDFFAEMEFDALNERLFGAGGAATGRGATVGRGLAGGRGPTVGRGLAGGQRQLSFEARPAGGTGPERESEPESKPGRESMPESKPEFKPESEQSRDPLTVGDGWDAAYRLIDSPESLRAAVSAFPRGGSDAPALAIDTETDGRVPLTAALVGLSFGWEPGRAWYVPVGHREGTRVSLEAVRETLGSLLADETVTKAGQNLKFDLHILRRHGLPVAGPLWDTMVASYVRDPQARHGLDVLAHEFLDHEMIPIRVLIGSGRQQVTMDTLSPEKVAPYACEDADAVVRLMPRLARTLEDIGARELFLELEMPLLPVLVAMEAAGIWLDRQMLSSMRHQLEAEQRRLEQEIHRLAGGPFNINSPKQLQVVLFETLKLPVKRKTKTGFSTDQEVLEELAIEHALPRKILEYRQLSKLHGTYVEALPRMVSEETGRIHASFHQTVTATGRLSSSDPNLQNIPIRTPMGRRVREAFAAPPGRVLLAADYSQIELRLLAHLSGDAYLTDAFRKGADIHRATAARVFGVDEQAVDPGMRTRAKTVNFGVLYGMGAQRLAREQGIPVKEASAFIADYFAKLPGVKAYIDQCVETARSRGYAETLLGRRRYLPGLQSGHHGDRAAAERMAVNTPVQGSAADLIKRAMVRLHARLANEHPEAVILLQVHDELVLELPEEALDAVTAVVAEEMGSVARLAVPLVVDSGAGRTWYEAHG